MSGSSRCGRVIIKVVELVAPIEAAFVRYLRDLIRGRGNQRFKENFRGTWNMYALKRENGTVARYGLSENYESS